MVSTVRWFTTVTVKTCFKTVHTVITELNTLFPGRRIPAIKEKTMKSPFRKGQRLNWTGTTDSKFDLHYWPAQEITVLAVDSAITLIACRIYFKTETGFKKPASREKWVYNNTLSI